MESALLSTGTVNPLKGIRKVAARRMVQAWQAPVFHLTTEIKMENILTAAKKSSGTTVTDVLLNIVAKSLQINPIINSHFNEDIVTTYSEINIGLAVATDAGLVVPVIHNCQSDSIENLAIKRSEKVKKSREGKLSMADIEGATFTISNLGMLGIDSFDAIINPPQVSILAISSTREIPIVVDNQIAIKKVANFTLTCDHRVIDGATGAVFLSTLRDLAENI